MNDLFEWWVYLIYLFPKTNLDQKINSRTHCSTLHLHFGHLACAAFIQSDYITSTFVEGDNNNTVEVKLQLVCEVFEACNTMNQSYISFVSLHLIATYQDPEMGGGSESQPIKAGSAAASIAKWVNWLNDQLNTLWYHCAVLLRLLPAYTVSQRFAKIALHDCCQIGCCKPSGFTLKLKWNTRYVCVCVTHVLVLLT